MMVRFVPISQSAAITNVMASLILEKVSLSKGFFNSILICFLNMRVQFLLFLLSIKSLAPKQGAL